MPHDRNINQVYSIVRRTKRDRVGNANNYEMSQKARQFIYGRVHGFVNSKAENKGTNRLRGGLSLVFTSRLEHHHTINTTNRCSFLRNYCALPLPG